MDSPPSRLRLWGLAIAPAVMWWSSGPSLGPPLGPLTGAWWLSMLVVAPWVVLAHEKTERWRVPVYVGALFLFLVSLQGLRHAHPWMFLPWIALSSYLAVYPVCFVALVRIWQTDRRVPLSLSAAVAWVGLEWIRNHLLTGISVLMLGHSVANVPWLIQIADVFGTYGVSFVLVAVGTSVAELCVLRGRWRAGWPSLATAMMLLAATLAYGFWTSGRDLPGSGATILLAGRHERTEYVQDPRREAEIYRSYERQILRWAKESETRVDAIVWPESMLSAGGPWMTAGQNLTVPEQPPGEDDSHALTVGQMRATIDGSQRYFEQTFADLQSRWATATATDPPAIIGGCAIVDYDEFPSVYSGVVMVNSSGRVESTYRKNHLVLFGETIPIVGSIPFLKDLMPPGMGLRRGTGPVVFELPTIKLLPNLCIETAVERIAVNHLRTFHQTSGDGSIPDAIVTLTNDAWFNQSAVVEHHLRCAQLVAVATRRPILSAANGGPTAWIDSDGQIVRRLSPGQDGNLLAKPERDGRISFYVRFGAIFAAIAGFIVLAQTIRSLIGWRKRLRHS